jgi:hypothetical protein
MAKKRNAYRFLVAERLFVSQEVSAPCSQLLRAKRGICRLASFNVLPIIPCKLMLLLRDKISFCETITLTDKIPVVSGYYSVGHLGYPLSCLKSLMVFFCFHRRIPLIDHENIRLNHDCPIFIYLIISLNSIKKDKGVPVLN